MRILILFFLSIQTLNSQVYHCDVSGPLEALNIAEHDLINKTGKNLGVPLYFHSLKAKDKLYYKDIIVELNNRFEGLFNFEYSGSSLIKNSNQFPWRNSNFSQSNNKNKCLNIYLVTDDQGNKGMASFPGELESFVFVNQSNFDLSNFDINNLVHEIGHYFGLLHTFSSHFGEEEVNGLNSSKTGDLLSDTQAEYNTISIKKYDTNLSKATGVGGQITHSKTVLLDGCIKISDSDNNLLQYKHTNSTADKWFDFPVTDNKGKSYGRMPNNYMSYVTKKCLNHQYSFTEGQKRRMTHFYNLYRKQEFIPIQDEDINPTEPIESNPPKKDNLFTRVNKKVISKSDTEYDGIYFKDNNGYKEILYNKAIEAHYVYNGNSLAWNYPKAFFLQEAQLTEVNTTPLNLKLVGSTFTDENINLLQISPLDHFNSYPGKMMHGIKTVWRDGENVYMPLFDIDKKRHVKIDFKKRKVNQNEHELLITGQLKQNTIYIIHSKKHFWIFKIK